VGADLGIRRSPWRERLIGSEGVVTGSARLVWGLVTSTTRICLRYRVTGLAAEAGFFALLSFPPLVLGMVASLGYVGEELGSDVVMDLRARISQLAETFLTQESVSSVILPTFDEVTHGGRIDLISLGFLLALWSGSRVLNVYVDTISIMYGLGGRRGIVRTRALSFSLYIAALVVGIVVIPLVLVGPGLLVKMLRGTHLPLVNSLGSFGALYWPVVTLLAVAGLATLYHVATPVRSPWRRDLPGAVLALIIWALTGLVLRRVIAASFGGTSIYGPLAAPIVVLIWLYSLAVAVLIGAALNAAIDERFPSPKRVAAREAGATHPDHPLTPVPEPDD
jgi:membrane protein